MISEVLVFTDTGHDFYLFLCIFFNKITNRLQTYNAFCICLTSGSRRILHEYLCTQNKIGAGFSVGTCYSKEEIAESKPKETVEAWSNSGC